MPPLRRRGRGGSGGRGAGATQQPRQQRTTNQQKTRQKRHFVTFFVGGAAPPLPPSSTPAAPQQHPSSTLTTPPRPNPDHTPTPHLYSADASSRRDAGNFFATALVCSSIHSVRRSRLWASTRQAGAGTSVQVAWGKYHHPQR